ncbi:Protein of unknown function [Pyronema omphalodes CBS 100304]|uniref:Uncharacterized protein n=1 Tax=Pyronema omphalodes (strain CBS 100304) TaxID=1076935 RepID=U4LWU4_PYROM|nr:Protein of unknown function [Pyronema omphalodes CBS 100304]
MASSPTSRNSALTPDPSEAPMEFQNIESPVDTHEKDGKEQEGSFEVPLFNFDEVMRYMRKLKEENVLLKEDNESLKEQLAIIKKEYEDKPQMDEDFEKLRQDKMELEMKLQKVLQYGTVKGMENVWEKCGGMEQKFREMKEEMKKELKQELEEEMKQELKKELQQQLKHTIEEPEENLASVSKKLKQVSKEMEVVKSQLTELNSEFLADAFTASGIKYISRRPIPDGNIEITGPYDAHLYYVERSFLGTYDDFAGLVFGLWALDLWDLGDELTRIIFNEKEMSYPEWSSKWASMIVKNISVY